MSNTPHRLGKYELQDLLGRGGMAEVWKAFDAQLRRYVAIKLLQADLQADPDFISRFTHEAQVVAALRHPNIVQIYDFHTSEQQGSDNATAYMVMEYVQGKTLAHYIHTTSHKKIIPSANEIVRLFTPISLALDYAHRQGTVHRDIKPANILLDQTQRARHPMGEPILSDFGLAKFLNTTSHTMGIFGTPLYMAPEQAQNKVVSSQTDLYALGVIYYEILTGVPPFQSDTLVGILMRHINDVPPDPRTLNAQLPEAVTPVLLKALSKNPSDRYSSASAMTIALAQAFDLAAPEDLQRSANVSKEGGMTVYSGEGEYASNGSGVQVSTTTSENEQDAEDDEVDPFSITISRADFRRNASLQLPDSEPPVRAYRDIAAEQTMKTDLDPNEEVQRLQKGQRVAPRAINPVTPLPLVNPEYAGQEMQDRPPTVHVDPSLPDTIMAPVGNVAPGKQPMWRRQKIRSIAIIVLILLFVFSGVGVFWLSTQRNQVAVGGVAVGQVSFLSSGQTTIGSSQGSNDELQISLHGIPNPPAGKKYYGWLLEDESQVEAPATSLGVMNVAGGNIQKVYVDPQHMNLLETHSRFLITQEDAGVTPIAPSDDAHAQLYSAEIPQTKGAGQKFSLLNHLRHLLASDPTLMKYHLAGGLDIWLQRNALSVRNEAGVARDDWDTKNYVDMYKQIVEILDYLDGSKYVGKDVPPGTPLVANAQAVQIGLLSLSANVDPLPYLPHVATHLDGIVQSPGVSVSQKNLATLIHSGLNYATDYLQVVRKDAMQLAQMNGAQLGQSSALSLLNDLQANANYAYDGRNDPTTNAQQLGVNQIYLDSQKMATFIVQANMVATK